MRRMARAVIQVVLAVLAVWGAAELKVFAETLVEQDGIELSGSVRLVARGVGRVRFGRRPIRRRSTSRSRPITASRWMSGGWITRPTTDRGSRFRL